jgi:MoxR-like ATPase
MKIEKRRIITDEEAAQMRLETDLFKCVANYRRAIGIPIVDQVRDIAPWVGTRVAIDLAVMSTFSAQSQVFLCEGPQGSGKTRLLETLSYAIALDAGGTPVIYVPISVSEETRLRELGGIQLLNQVTGKMYIEWSDVFKAHVIHVDEATRATTQLSNGLLQLLQKRGQTCKGVFQPLLPVHIFGVTCNPEGYLGTRPQPLAFWDRFGGCAWMPHLNRQEREVLNSEDCYTDPDIGNYVKPVITLEQIKAIRDKVKQIVLPKRCTDYIGWLTTAYDLESGEFDELHNAKIAAEHPIVGSDGEPTVWDAEKLRQVLPPLGAGLSVRPDISIVQLLKSWLFCNVDEPDPRKIGYHVTDQVIQYIYRLAAWKRVNINSTRLSKVDLISLVIERATAAHLAAHLAESKKAQLA